MRKNIVWPKLLLLLTTIIWGSSFFILKNTLDSIPPFLVLAIRFSVSTLILPILFFRKIHFTLPLLWQGAVLGFFLFLSYALQTYGLFETTPGKNAFLTTVYCILAPLLGYLSGRQKPQLHHILAALLCLCGIALVALNGDLSMKRGDVLTLLGGCGFALHILFLNKYGENADSIMLTSIQFAFCALFCWASTFIFEGIPHYNLRSSLLPLAYLSIFCTAIAFCFQSLGQKYTSLTSSAIILSLEAVFGVIFSILFYHEAPTFRVFCGFGLILVSILLSELGFPFGKKKENLLP